MAIAEAPQKHIKAKICLVGEVAVGKSSLIKRFVLDAFEDRYVATIGTKVTKKTVSIGWRGQPASLDMMIWDIMGERGFRTLLKEAYFHGAQAVIAVCDVTRRDTFYDLNNWINLAKRELGDVPIVFLGNKVDLVDRAVVTHEDLDHIGENQLAPYFFTSARNGENVEAAFRAVATAIIERHGAWEP